MKLIKKIFAIAAIVVFAISSTASETSKTFSAKYVFLFIGDGFSLPQRAAGDWYLKAQGKSPMCVNNFTYKIPTNTSSANSIVTDSAASGTAIACGTLTKNGCLGLDSNGNRLESVAELAHKKGMKVGLISTTPITHATPAAFYAHRKSRSNGYGIGLDMVACQFDFLGAGGVQNNDEKNNPDYCGDIYEKLIAAKYNLVRDRKSFENLKAGDSKIVVAIEKGYMPFLIDAKADAVRITDMVAKSIELLDNPNGFFIMCEGGRIDSACHMNDLATAMKETEEFNNVILQALEFAKKYPNETLIVVTGDHETGGLTLGHPLAKNSIFAKNLLKQKMSRDSFKAELIKLLQQDKLTFDSANELAEEVFGIKLTKAQKEELKPLFEKTSPKKLDISTLIGTDISFKPDYTKKICHFAANFSGFNWGTTGHTALPVITYAVGADADLFLDVQANSDIANKLKQIVAARKAASQN